MHEKHRANLEKYKKKKQREQKRTRQQNNYKRERELRKEGRESLVVSLQVRDQLKRVPLKEARN